MMKIMMKDVPWTKVWLREAARQVERTAVEIFAEHEGHAFVGLAYAPGKRLFQFSLDLPDDKEKKMEQYRQTALDIRQKLGSQPLALITITEAMRWDPSKEGADGEPEEILHIEVEHTGLRGFAVCYPIQLVLTANGKLARRLDRSRCERIQQEFSHRSLLGFEVLGSETKASPQVDSVVKKVKRRTRPVKDDRAMMDIKDTTGKGACRGVQ
jgi:hypothetical protein